MVGKKRLRVEEISGIIFNQGSRKKNIVVARRKLTNRGFKGRFKISVSKTPKSTNVSVRFKALRKLKKR